MKKFLLAILSILSIKNIGLCAAVDSAAATSAVGATSAVPSTLPSAATGASAGAGAGAGAASFSMKLVAYKFGMAMLGVVISSLVIYALLTIYNKYFHKNINTTTTTTNKSLESPKNLKDSINVFLDKTKWN